MSDILKAHLFQCQCRIDRTPTTGTKNNDRFFLLKLLTIVRAGRISPKLKHPTGDVFGTWNGPQVNEFLNLS